MSRLSETSFELLKVIRDFPGLDGEQLKRQHFSDSPQPSMGNNLKLLEQHGYIVYQEKSLEAPPGWFLTGKGTDVLKYG